MKTKTDDSSSFAADMNPMKVSAVLGEGCQLDSEGLSKEKESATVNVAKRLSEDWIQAASESDEPRVSTGKNMLSSYPMELFSSDPHEKGETRETDKEFFILVSQMLSEIFSERGSLSGGHDAQLSAMLSHFRPRNTVELNILRHLYDNSYAENLLNLLTGLVEIRNDKRTEHIFRELGIKGHGGYDPNDGGETSTIVILRRIYADSLKENGFIASLPASVLLELYAKA